MRFTAEILKAKRPYLTTVHLVSLDFAQHKFGPDTAEAHRALERIDSVLGALVAVARHVHPDIVLAIVSDHGFAPLAHQVNLKSLFVEDGLITLSADKKSVVGWTAFPWSLHGSAEVLVSSPKDASLQIKVANTLAMLQRRPELGIDRVINQEEAAQRGGNDEAAFFINFKIGYEMGEDLVAPTVSMSKLKGMHGYFPELPEMQATFILSGAGLSDRGSIGQIDIRDIAPTLARHLRVSLPDAEGVPH